MLARLLIQPFGKIWNLKKLCFSKNIFISKSAKILYGFYQYENNSAIAWNSTFKSEPFFPHGIKSIFISGGAKIGSDCIIFQQVTIGSNTLIDSKGIGAPSLGDNVYVGSGATIIGAVKIGNNVRIGANTVVYQDVPDNSIVVSGEQKIITKETKLDNRFYSFNNQWVYYSDGSYHQVTDEEKLKKLNILLK